MSHRVAVRAALVVAAISFAAPAAANAAFSTVASPNPGVGNDELRGVGAGSATDAWAVGTMASGVEDAGLGSLTEHWNGTAWSAVPSPDALHVDDVLNAAADLSPSNAWAVGFVKTSGTKTGSPLIIHWNGASWTGAAVPTGSSGTLRAISADRATDVWAVGDDGRGHAIAFRFTGTAWAATSLPAIGIDNLQGVKAFSPTDVWAVGSRIPVGASNSQTLVMHWNGSAWSVVPSANPDPTVDVLHAIDGVSSNDLWAVGQQHTPETISGAGPGSRTLAEHWNGSRWTAAAAPNTGDDDTLNAAAAISTNSVVAAGIFTDRSPAIPTNQTLADRWNGSAWVADQTDNSGGTDNLLNGAATDPGTGTAWAVGFRLTSAGPSRTLIERGS